MGLFRRNKSDTGMPAEIQDYYKAENRERTWVAWLLAFVTLVVTVLLVLGLFFGGRMAYRKLKKQNNPTPVSVQTDSPQTQTSPTQSTPPTTAQTPSTTPVPTNSSPTTPTAQSPNPTSNRPESSNLPNTGPGDLLAIFVATSVTGAIAHYKIFRTRTAR